MSKAEHQTVAQRIHAYVTQNPGSTTAEIVTALSTTTQYSFGSITSSLYDLKRTGLLTSNKLGKSSQFFVKEPFDSGKLNTMLRNRYNASKRNNAFVRTTNQPQSTNENSASVFVHQYMIRPGVFVRMELPADVSQAEVGRLCNFLKTVPME